MLAQQPCVELYASLLSGDAARIADQVAQLEESGAIHGLHIDVMDGSFVPNLAFGPQVVAALQRRTKLPIEVHLMVDRPNHLLSTFADAGASRLIVHAEATAHLHRDVAAIRALGLAPGVALNPATPLCAVESLLEEIDELLLMGVDPGFGGQAFITSVLAKIAQARTAISTRTTSTSINIDGGVKADNARSMIDAGATRLVVGSALFAREALGPCARDFAASIGTAQPAAIGGNRHV